MSLFSHTYHYKEPEAAAAYPHCLGDLRLAEESRDRHGEISMVVSMPRFAELNFKHYDHRRPA